MKLREMLIAVLSVVAIGLMSDSAMAEKISIQGHAPKDVKAGCDGTYFSPSKMGVYGCLNNDGSGIVCGGKGKDAKTCDTFMKVPPCLPTREDITKAEKAEQAGQSGQTGQSGQGVVYAGKWCCASCSKNATTGALECKGCTKGHCFYNTTETGYLNVDCPGNTTESGTNVTCY